jgi:hypothetical protein
MSYLIDPQIHPPANDFSFEEAILTKRKIETRDLMEDGELMQQFL